MIDLRPSSSGIWTVCALAPHLWQGVADVETDAAREGTCAAWLAETCVREDRDPIDMLDVQHPNGWVVDNEMVYHIQGYVDRLRSYDGVVDVERKVRLNAYIAGTPDAFAVVRDDRLVVDDLKYGYRAVDPTSPQMFIYAGAILRRLLSRQDVKIKQVTLGIYQPRIYHPSGPYRSVTMWPEEIMSYVHEIELAAERVQQPSPIATPGGHCRYCKAAGVCSAAANALYDAYETMRLGQERDLTIDEIGRELEFLGLVDDLVTARKTAIKAEATTRLDRGERIPGWHMQHGSGRRKWSASADTVHLMTGVDPTDTTMVTPAELERRGANRRVVRNLTETVKTAPSLKRIPQGYFAAMFGET